MSFSRFLIDIFDVPSIDKIENLSSIIDKEASSIIYANIFKHPRIVHGLVFSQCWQVMFNQICPRIHIYEYTLTHDMNVINIPQICGYVVKHTFLKYVVSQEIFTTIVRQCSAFAKHENIKHELVDKTSKRHNGVTIPNKDVALFATYPDKNIPASQFINSNPFTNHVPLKSSMASFEYLTLLEQQSYIVSIDMYFSRMLYGNIGIFTKYENVIDIFANAFPAKKIVVFTDVQYSSCRVYKCSQEDTNLIPYKLLDYYICDESRTILGKNNLVVDNQGIMTISDTCRCDLNLTGTFWKDIYTCAVKTHLVKKEEKYSIALDYIVKHVHPLSMNKFEKPKENCILLVDNRDNVMDVASVYLTMANLIPDKWDVVFIGSKTSLEYFKSNFNDTARYIHDARLDKSHFDIELYNEIMKDPDTWQHLVDYKKCLVIQEDGMIIRRGLESMFLHYDYVGSPWVKCPGNQQIEDLTNGSLVGNGGLSLRDVKLSLKVCQEYANTDAMLLFNSELQPIPEDVFFCRCIQKLGGQIPTFDEACKFGTEEVITKNSLGFHKIWAYHSSENIRDFFQ